LADSAILAQLINESGIKYHQTKKSYVFTCPRCSGKKKLYVLKASGRFCCWVCKNEGYQGRPEYALADLLQVPVKQIQAKLYGYGNIQTQIHLELHLRDFFDDDDDLDEDAFEIPTVAWPIDYYPIDDPAAEKGLGYLQGRGIDLETAKAYGIRYSPEKRRVMFPVENNGELYGWQGRIIIPHKWVDEEGNEREIIKIESSTGIPREHTLMFADRLRGCEHAVLCEGPLDALKSHLCGGKVAAMGKAVSPNQIRLLLNAGDRKLYLALDPDAAGETQKIVRDCFDDVELYTMLATGSGEKPDLGAMEYQDVYELFKKAKRIEAGRLFFYLNPKFAR
jgi:hypothetical protein